MPGDMITLWDARDWNKKRVRTKRVRLTPTLRNNISKCGTCGRMWDDSIVTDVTPAPSARCPFEYFHKYDRNDDPSRGSLNRVARTGRWMFT